MVIKILGAGCANCKKLEAISQEVVRELAVQATVEHVTDFKAIMAYGIMATPGLVIDEKVVSAMATPGLVIDEKVVSAGRIPSKAEVTTWITTALSAAK